MPIQLIGLRQGAALGTSNPMRISLWFSFITPPQITWIYMTASGPYETEVPSVNMGMVTHNTNATRSLISHVSTGRFQGLILPMHR